MYWKKWPAKHEYEELKEGTRLASGLALLRKKVTVNWNEKHRNVARKIFVEGGLDAKKLCDIYIFIFVGYQSMSSLQKRGRDRKTQAIPLPRMVRSQTRESRSFPEVGAKSKNLKAGVDVAKRYW